MQTIKKLSRLIKRFFIELRPITLPRTEAEFLKLKQTLIDLYDLEDSPEIWHTVCGAITSTPAWRLKKPILDIVNPAKRLKVNKVAHDQKMLAYEQVELKLKEKLAEEVKKLAETTEVTGAPV